MKIKYLIVMLTILLFVIACAKEVKVAPEPEPEPVPEAICSDNIQNQGEEGVDCGGPCKACPTCSDGIQNQRELGIDCGGPCKVCATCTDLIQNQNEEGVDCGGECKPCPVTKYEIYTEDYFALNEKMKSNIKAVFLKSSLPTGLQVGEPYVFALGLTNTMAAEELFMIDVNFKDARDFTTNAIDVDEETILGWFEINDWDEYTLAQYENEPIPVGVTVGEWIAPGVQTKPGIYYFEVEITYKGKYSTKEYSTEEFNFRVNEADSTGSSCSDGILNQGEEAVDCGGPCESCGTCTDGVQNQYERGIDCDGPCKPCPVEKYEIYSEDYFALNEKMKSNIKAVFLRSTLPTGLQIDGSYVFALGLTNTMETEETFVIDVAFNEARNLQTNPIVVDDETVLEWFEKNDWGEYTLAKYDNVPIPVGVTAGEWIAPGVQTKPGNYYFEVIISYKTKYGTKEYTKLDFNFLVK